MTTLRHPGRGVVHTTTTARSRSRATVFTNDNGAGNGSVDLQQALTVSSDVYFYTAGQRLLGQLEGRRPATRPRHPDGRGRARLRQEDRHRARRGGGPHPRPRVEDRVRGRELQEGSAGAAATNSIWYPGDNIHAAVGQGDDLVTPLQLANAYATLRERRHAVDAARRRIGDRPDDEEDVSTVRAEGARHRRDRPVHARADGGGLHRRGRRPDGHRVRRRSRDRRSRWCRRQDRHRRCARARASTSLFAAFTPIADPAVRGRRGRRGRRARRADRGADRPPGDRGDQQPTRSRRSRPATGTTAKD